MTNLFRYDVEFDDWYLLPQNLVEEFDKLLNIICDYNFLDESNSEYELEKYTKEFATKYRKYTVSTDFVAKFIENFEFFVDVNVGK